MPNMLFLQIIAHFSKFITIFNIMTDQELKDLVASFAINHKEMLRMEREERKEMLRVECEERKEMLRVECEERKEMLRVEREEHKEMLRMEREEHKEMLRVEREEHKEMLRVERKEYKEMRNETERMLQEALIIQKETGLQIKELSEDLKKLDVQLGGISNNQGHHAEQFFQDVFKKKLEFGMVKYDEMIPNLSYKGKKNKIEFDIALVNGDCIALIEIKNRIYPDFVKELAEERIEKFREYFREFENYDVYLGIAGFSFCDEVLDQASRYGIGVVKQVGDSVEMETSNLKVY